MIPEFSKLFKEWETISSKFFILNQIEQSGRFSQLLRSGRKRTFEDIEKDKEEYFSDEIKRAKKEKEEASEELKLQVEKFEKLKMDYLEDESRLAKLYEMGVIDSKGDYMPNSPDDHDDMK